MGNATSLLMVLPMLEEKYKARWLIAISLLNAMIAAIVTMVMYKSQVVLGASGIVYQTMILAVFSGRYRGIGDIPVTFLLAVVVFMVPEFQAFNSGDGLSHAAHIIGGLVGAWAGCCAHSRAYILGGLQRTAVTVTAPRSV
eukprot:TRINITY_DN23164_c0_g1_i2.p1 TRINITY_DN23164_c0_g1~~TRINITY_DN23164_c0_g1_i2.p1  ORF type:complete len:141 (-),score=9.47 TRINITY_DN23164_c0_g1_i2:87-509(-)